MKFLIAILFLTSCSVRIPDRVFLQMARFKATTTDGTAEILISLPSSRYIKGGKGWFENPHVDDYVQVNILAADDSVVSSFVDGEMVTDSQGWYFKPGGVVEIGPIIDGIDIDPSQVPGGLRVQIKAFKGSGEDTLRMNLEWGRRL